MTILFSNDESRAVNTCSSGQTCSVDTQKEREIDEVMEFLKFSVKPSTNFDGTILFNFKTTNDSEPNTTYAVKINHERQVATRKNVSAKDVHPKCEVTISMDDFLWVYSDLVGNAGPVSTSLAGRVISITTSNLLEEGREIDAEFERFFTANAKQSATIVDSLAFGNSKQTANTIFDLLDENFIVDVKRSARERQQCRHIRNRVDLGDAGMAQLAKLVHLISKEGHSNQKQDNRSKYVPALELLLREFRVNVTVLMDTLKEKASGRKALHKIPAPEMDWLIRNRRSDSMVIADCSSQNKFSAMSTLSSSALSTFPESMIVEVNRSKSARIRKRFDMPKRRIKAKLTSITRDLANQKTPFMTYVDEHLVFSDYL
ncbi:hypothetical protein PsorP6_002370 [Peronosclerospora sorghi]|uniref:Uncharacterized protein n=1 Tax=Peronosclerospora sorghi TaxID=230839 RepID=A0ACC0WXQ5_9STRA|nr:hypothetical protein PsorP6_002370 [Peronosclerospora sorghi]